MAAAISEDELVEMAVCKMLRMDGVGGILILGNTEVVVNDLYKMQACKPSFLHLGLGGPMCLVLNEDVRNLTNGAHIAKECIGAYELMPDTTVSNRPAFQKLDSSQTVLHFSAADQAWRFASKLGRGSETLMLAANPLPTDEHQMAPPMCGWQNEHGEASPNALWCNAFLWQAFAIRSLCAPPPAAADDIDVSPPATAVDSDAEDVASGVDSDTLAVAPPSKKPRQPSFPPPFQVQSATPWIEAFGTSADAPHHWTKNRGGVHMRVAEIAREFETSGHWPPSLIFVSSRIMRGLKQH